MLLQLHSWRWLFVFLYASLLFLEEGHAFCSVRSSGQRLFPSFSGNGGTQLSNGRSLGPYIIDMATGGIWCTHVEALHLEAGLASVLWSLRLIREVPWWIVPARDICKGTYNHLNCFSLAPFVFFQISVVEDQEDSVQQLSLCNPRSCCCFWSLLWMSRVDV